MAKRGEERKRPRRYREACPDDLWRREAKLLRLRRSKCGSEESNRTGKQSGFQVGLALSGGGLRSATFSLGIVQALARLRVLGKIDALSTVSGGGYTGSMVSRLFQRDSVWCVEDVERAISRLGNATRDEEGCSGKEEGCSGKKDRIQPGSVYRWLQDNGHHLAPNGGGDLLLAIAVTIRNWFFVQVMLAMLFLGGFILMQLLRQCSARLAEAWPPVELAMAYFGRLMPDGFWWSPWIVVAFLPLVVCGLFGLLYWVGQCRLVEAGGPESRTPSSGHSLSVAFKYSLLAAVSLFGVALVDTMGLAAYVHWRSGSLGEVLLAGAGAAVAFAAAASRLATSVLPRGAATRPKNLLRVVAGVVGGSLVAVWLTTVNGISHGIAWEWELPVGVPCVHLVVCRDCCVAQTGSISTLLWWFFVLGVTSTAAGHCLGFLNGSSLQPLYSARITRAFLGASNPERIRGAYQPTTRVVEGDDADIAWDPKGDRVKQFCKGAPLHFINVTVNENLDNKTRLQRAERGGMG